MDLQEIQTYLTQNAESPEVKTYLDSFKVQPTLEVFKSKLNESDFKSFLDSEKDKHASKSLESWKTNNLPKEVEALYKKNHPDADPKDIELNNLKAEFEKMKQDTLRKDLTNKALKIAQEKKLPTDLIDFFIGSDEDTTTKNLEKFMTTMAAHDEAIKTEFAKGNSYTPPNGDKSNLSSEDKIRAEISKYMK